MKTTKFSILTIVITTILTAGALGGCQAEKYSVGSLTFEIPEGWLVAEEREHNGTHNLKLESKDYDMGYVIITSLEAEKHSEEEIIGEARDILESSLFEIRDEIETGEELIDGTAIPVLKASAGKREMVNAQTAIIIGEEKHIYVTMVVKEDGGKEYNDVFNSLLRDINAR